MAEGQTALWSEGGDPLPIEKLWADKLNIQAWWRFRERWRWFRFNTYRNSDGRLLDDNIQLEILTLSYLHFSAYMYLASSRYRLDELESIRDSAENPLVHFRLMELLKVIQDHLYSAGTAAAVEAFIVAGAGKSQSPFVPSEEWAPSIRQVRKRVERWGLHEVVKWLDQMLEILALRDQFAHLFWPPRGVDEEGRLKVAFSKKGLTIPEVIRKLANFPSVSPGKSGHVATTAEIGSFEQVYSSAASTPSIAARPSIPSEVNTPLDISRDRHSRMEASLDGLYATISGDLLDGYWLSRKISLERSDRITTELGPGLGGGGHPAAI